jgi:hypothetical protein
LLKPEAPDEAAALLKPAPNDLAAALATELTTADTIEEVNCTVNSNSLDLATKEA